VPGEFKFSRIDCMLTVYGDIFVKEAAEEAEKQCRELTPAQEYLARQLGECRAWAVHDSFFIWDRPLSNTFEELREFICEQKPEWYRQMIRSWADLKKRTLELAGELLHRVTYPPFPDNLTEELNYKWWQYMAIAHQCCIELREII